ncbi:MAG: IS3 family transposase [Tenericutes bacterium]|nr:IS3 family transposase [Mycoplasmatota bacterium]
MSHYQLLKSIDKNRQIHSTYIVIILLLLLVIQEAIINPIVFIVLIIRNKTTDNAVIESLNGWIKSDLKKNLRIQDFQDPWTAIEVYVNYFNNNRPSWKLDYLSPVEYRTINNIK